VGNYDGRLSRDSAGLDSGSNRSARPNEFGGYDGEPISQTEGTERFGVNERTERNFADRYSDGRRRAAFREQI
jgi:hypothetical protein